MIKEEKKIGVIGGGNYAKIVISILKQISLFEIVGYTDVSDNGSILGVKYLGNDDILIKLFENDKIKFAAIGIGQLYSTNVKRKVVLELKKIGYNFPVIISPTAFINEDVSIGEGTIIRNNALISVSTKIGDFSIIGTSVNINHDTQIGNYTNVTIGSNIGIECVIGDNILIGMSSIVMNYVKIVVDRCLLLRPTDQNAIKYDTKLPEVRIYTSPSDQTYFKYSRQIA